MAQHRRRFPWEAEAGFTVIASLGITALLLLLRAVGGLEWIELVAYDGMMRLRPSPSKDERLLVVGITEKDIQDRGGYLQLSDGIYAEAIAKLQQSSPRAIGLDIYRDKSVEPGHKALLQQLQKSDRVIAITKLADQSQPTIAAPPGLSSAQIGFNNVVVDRDGVLRRALLFNVNEKEEVFPSFALVLAARYLQDQGIEPQANAQDPDLTQLGSEVLLPLHRRRGAYVRNDTRGEQILLNYRGNAQVIPQVSLGDLLAGKIAPAQIRDRIILIGQVAESARDFFYTPFSAGSGVEHRMPGVVIHAQMVSQFLDIGLGQRRLLWLWSTPLEMGWILLWSLLGGLLAWRSRHPLLLTVLLFGSTVLLFGLCFSLFLLGGWIPLVPTLLGFILTSGSVVAYIAQQAQQQQQMVMRLLGQSTSPEIAETLWQKRDELLQNGKLPGQKLRATLLFTDLRGFSSISEQYSPEQLLILLNEYLGVITTLVQNHQGVINKFTGDGIMAVFGVPIPHESEAEIQADARHAVDCAIAMGEALEHLNQQWKNRGFPLLQMRVGIFTGSVVTGSLGSAIRLEYGVIGDSVNIASRLESLDKDRQPTACRILIARQTKQYLSTEYTVESWGAMSLKGKEEQVEVFRVIGRSESSSEVL
jgi:adenylate cyclase